MTRKHSRNSCAGPCYTYAERQVDGKKYGTQSQRIGKESVKDFDCCWLTLHPCKDPVVTPQGYLFEKEAIYEYILHQKRENARKLKLYEEEVTRAMTEAQEQEVLQAQQVVKDFVKLENSVSGENSSSVGQKYARPSQNEDVRVKWDATQTKLRRNFWIPENTPTAKVALPEKPDQNIYCPISGKKLKIKDLTTVKFTPLDKASSSGDASLLTAKEKWMCPLTFETLTNATPCAVLRTSGSVVTMDAVNQILKKDMVDPINGEKLSEDDIIPLIRGGTGFAAAGVDLTPKKYTPVLQAS